MKPDDTRSFERDEIAAYMDAAASVVGLVIPAGSREGVIANLRTIFDRSAALMALDLDWSDEAAPVFHP